MYRKTQASKDLLFVVIVIDSSSSNMEYKYSYKFTNNSIIVSIGYLLITYTEYKVYKNSTVMIANKVVIYKNMEFSRDL